MDLKRRRNKGFSRSNYRPNTITLKRRKDLNRKRRKAPIEVVGSVLSGLFGALDQEDAAIYNEEIDKLRVDVNY